MAGWVFPIDLDCPEVKEFYEGLYGDPMTDMIPGDVLGEITSGWENQHRTTCKRCQEFGAENVEVGY
jgi:hypothetical protein